MIIDILEKKITKPISNNAPHLTDEEKNIIMSRVLQTQTGKEAIIDAIQRHHESGREVITDSGESLPSKCGDLIALSSWLTEFSLDDDWILEVIDQVPITRTEIDFWYATYGTFACHMDRHWPNLRMEKTDD